MRNFRKIILALPVLTAPLWAGGMWLQVGNPAANAEATAKQAVLVARITACHAPEKTALTATAEGLTTAVGDRMLRVGERTGLMGEMMERIGNFHDEEISRWVEWLTKLIEPILMAVIGGVIGGIIILMYMPIFQLAGNVG